MTAAASYIFNTKVPGYLCRTLLRPEEQRSTSGLTHSGPGPRPLTDCDFQLILYEDFARASQHQLQQWPQLVHPYCEKEEMGFVWQSGTTTSCRNWGREGMETCALKSLSL